VVQPIHDPRPTTHAVAARGGKLLVAALALLAGGCSNMGYYWQSVNGQLDIWRRERPVAEVMADPATTGELKAQLARVAEIRDFASRELALPDNRSYRSYADLERPFVVWNVFAAPEFSVQPQQWCLLFAGCVSYRGYFSKPEADRFAAGLVAEGSDVYVGGVPAYSTLGYFDDPLLNTFIRYPEYEVARLLFHELAHQVAYAKGDSVFNESFAVSVEQEGMRRWLAQHGDERQRADFERAQLVRREFIGMVEQCRGRLAALYRTRLAPDAMREKKREILAGLEAEYQARRKTWGGYNGYDRWFASRPNNAQLASVAIYTRLVPQFEALLAREGGDLPRFYAAVKELAALPMDQRQERLAGRSAPSGN
jgi:predicted aminopeptidase